MKFRPKRSKSDALPTPLSDSLPHDPLDDPAASDVSEDELENADIFPDPATEPLTPPNTPRRQKQKVSSRDVLRLQLHHGDVLIQQGRGLQKYYEVLSLAPLSVR
jgi:hypothetical protein